MKLSVSAYRAHAAAHKKILSSYQLNYGSTSASAAPSSTSGGSITTIPTSGPTPQVSYNSSYLFIFPSNANKSLVTVTITMIITPSGVIQTYYKFVSPSNV